MYKINKTDMQTIVNGASFLASGGGGGVASALDVIDNITHFSNEVSVVGVEELHSGDELLVICGVGAPDAPNLNFNYSAGFGLTGLQEMSGKTFSHVLPIEVGAMNSMIPLLACAQYNIPFVDGDGAGRSVPQMSMCSYALKGFPTQETLVVSETDVQFPLHPANARQMERDVRKVVSNELHNAGTVATWPISAQQLKAPAAFVPGSLSLARSLGVAMATQNPLEEVRAIIGNFYADNRIITRKGRVIAATNKVEDGFDVGTITAQDEAGMTVRLYFVNESLFATIDYHGQPSAFILGPDMICCMGVDGTPMTNSEICSRFESKQSIEICLLWVKALDTIRTPGMFFQYLTLLTQKFSSASWSGYTFIEDIPDLLD